tara:strand:+ start:307 stop:1473 length:1167 start_codon:yes stop_codon:yes gene_type:complete
MVSSKIKVGIVGLGYVGLSNCLLLAKEHDVLGYDIDTKKVNNLEKKISHLAEKCIQTELESTKAKFTNSLEDLQSCEFILIAVPTNFDQEKKSFDTTIVEGVIRKLHKLNNKAILIIKSTVPIGFSKSLTKKLNTENIIFSPEFLREGMSMIDSLNPSRIIIGSEKNEIISKKVTGLFKSCIENNPSTIQCSSSEAEAIKLFSNTYLAMRVAFFNEIDSFALANEMNSRNIIDGMGLDPRIGSGYNNPSFGYGGYCLPKDTKQALSNFEGVPQKLISAIVDSNSTRINYIAEIIARKFKKVGMYRLLMKKDSDNIRSSSSTELLESLVLKGVQVTLFEPKINKIEGVKITDNIQQLSKCEVVLINRLEDTSLSFKNIIFTRDIYNSDK